MKVTGHLRLIHRTPGGELIAAWEADNLIVNEGLAYIASTALVSGAAYLNNIGVAKNAGAVAPAETGGDITDGLYGVVTARSRAGAVARHVATIIGPFGGDTYYSAVLVDSDTLPTLIARALIGTTHLAENDELEITWSITVTT